MDYRIDNVELLLSGVWHRDGGSEMHVRGANGLVICDGSEFSFFCNGKEVSITTEGSIWGGIGLPRDLTVKLNTDKTFDQVYE